MFCPLTKEECKEDCGWLITDANNKVCAMAAITTTLIHRNDIAFEQRMDTLNHYQKTR